MKSAELIAALRCCIVDFNSTQSRLCNKCPCRIYADGKRACENKVKRDAADALEAAEKRIAELEKQDSVEMHKKQVARIADLEAQIPKEGEWVRNDKEQDGFDDVVWRYAKCTVCGDSRFSYYAARKNFRYCPNCGAKMRGEQE